MLGLAVGTVSIDVFNAAFVRNGISGTIDQGTDAGRRADIRNSFDEILGESDQFYLFLLDNYPELSKKYKALTEDLRLSFQSDFSNNASILSDFNSGSIKVSIWDELTTLNRVGLSKNETALKFLSQIDGTEAAIALKRKLLLVLDDPKLLQFIADFGSDFRKLAIFGDNLRLLDSWKKVSNFTSETKEWIQTSIPLLRKMADETSVIQDKIVDYYQTFQKPSISGAPPFSYTTSSGHLVEYDIFAQPRFEPHVPEMKGVGKISYAPDELSDLPAGNNSTLMGTDGHDIADANRWIEARYPDKAVKTSGGQINILVNNNGTDEWITCVWHHHEAGRHLMPVPIEIHNRPLGGASHTGGNSIIDKGLKDFFNLFTGF